MVHSRASHFGMSTPYQNEIKALEESLNILAGQVDDLRVNAVQLGEKKNVPAWQVEDVHHNRLFVVISGLDSPEGEETDPVFTAEAEVGQFIGVDPKEVVVFLELNYTQMTLARLALTPDQRLVVLFRRWLQGISAPEALEGIAEVWNVAQNLRDTLQPQEPGNA